MGTEDRHCLETETTTEDKLDTKSKPNFILEYMKKFSDSFFEVCEDYLELGKIVSFSSIDSGMALKESGSFLRISTSIRRWFTW